jgi:hypothetical protein
MQRHEIPTHLDVEDKLFAGLSARQLLILILGIGLGYSVWQRGHHLLPLPLAAILAALPVLASFALATLRPDDRPLEQWLLAFLRYHGLPRVCLLDRAGDGEREVDLSAAELAALEDEWRALRLAARAAAQRETDEWGMDATHAVPAIGGERLSLGNGPVSG